MAHNYATATTLAGKTVGGQVPTANADTTIYTVPANTGAKIGSAAILNSSPSVPSTVTVYVVPSGAAIDATHKIVTFTLQPGDSTTLDELVGNFLESGAVLAVRADVANAVNYLVTMAVSA
jgi:hypothetical protein